MVSVKGRTQIKEKDTEIIADEHSQKQIQLTGEIFFHK